MKDYYNRFQTPPCADRWTVHDEAIMGEYNPCTHVYRLQEDVAGEVPFTGELAELTAPDYFKASAFGTHLHELSHWWQFIGSTAGLLQSLVIPTQALHTAPYIQQIPASIRLVKPLYLHATRESLKLQGEAEQNINIAVNNWMDLEFAQCLIHDPRRAEEVANEPLFESQGHAFQMLYGLTLEVLWRAFDPELRVLPDFRKWTEPFRGATAMRLPDYDHYAPMRVPELGFSALAEGQSRFSQLQFLHLSSGGGHDWDYWRTLGLLGDRYTEAMELYCMALDLPWPSSPTAPEVDLFLLLCDIALNPAPGYPHDIEDFGNFVADVHPGWRFTKALRFAAGADGLAESLDRLDRAEYEEVAGRICEGCDWPTPQELAATIADFPGKCEGMATLDDELRTNEFDQRHMPTRLVYALHVAHMKDKARYPELFCWPGGRSIVGSGTDESERVRGWQRVFSRNGPPFIAQGLKHRVEYSYRPDSTKTSQPANDYFVWHLFFDQVRQLMSAGGPLSYRYSWLDPERDDAYFRDFLISREDIIASLGRPLDAFEPAA